MLENATIGERLRSLIWDRNMTQLELAKLCGVEQAAISNICTDNSRKPSAPTLLELCRVFQCSPDWLMFGTGEPYQLNTIGRPDEQELVRLYREAQPIVRESVLVLLKSLAAIK
jgi:transcriptional regulator with XRE-family HTH domain